mmetsp:Transcript_5270/g.14708  ORF Transcript_5270/g.14708 Transcript_5270/m.14708 type:complete len:224 (-) Transcript_5270:66-737(-)
MAATKISLRVSSPQVASSSSRFNGSKLSVRAAPAVRLQMDTVVKSEAERLRLNNLSPQAGARHKETRKGRGYSAGQGGPCGFGMRGQKARSGSGTRPGFEGGQLPMYRKLPKLKGICGGNPAGRKGHVTVNLADITAAKFAEGDEVSLQTLKEKRVLNVSGKDAKLPLKVLGEGELPFGVTIKATSFSETAKSQIESAGGTIVEVPRKAKWTRKAAKAAGKSK